MKTVLMDCAHCGDEATIFVSKTGEHWIIKCKQCSAMMQGRREEEPRFNYLDQREALIREWNKRYGSK